MNRETYEPSEITSVADLLDQLVSKNLVTAATAVIASADAILDERAVSQLQPEQGTSVASELRFDFASLTKPWTATVAVALDETRTLPLDTTVGSIWSSAAESLKRVSMADLLRHEGGFQAWAPLYHLCKARKDVAEFLLEGAVLGAKAGTYSDLGYILWGVSAEQALGRDLGSLYMQVLGGLSPESTLGPSSSSITPIHPCALDTDVEQRLARDLGHEIATLGTPGLGEVQDGNARFMGGFSSHAGLFGAARDLVELGRCWLTPDRYPAAATAEIAVSGNEAYGLGWARRDTSKSAGETLDRNSFGHTGFTGSSVWVDPSAERILVLAAHRASTDVDLARWRRAFHRLALGGQTGLEM
jgi:CubicO group peptidase (beta-lactamase class C family)